MKLINVQIQCILDEISVTWYINFSLELRISEKLVFAMCNQHDSILIRNSM